MRELRCFARQSPDLKGFNTWAGSPGNDGPGAYWVLRIVVAGPVSARTGYLCNIADLDSVLRTTVLPFLQGPAASESRGARALAAGLIEAFAAAAERSAEKVQSLELRVSDHLTFSVYQGDSSMVRVTQSFEFSAAHRLHSPALSEEMNRRIFGKCANANGHGHNYVVDVTVAHPPAVSATAPEVGGAALDIEHVQRVVKARVIDRFDHKHLNLDCAEFAELNPSVENIARVIWEKLSGAFTNLRLTGVRVWETPKTYAEYDGTD